MLPVLVVSAAETNLLALQVVPADVQVVLVVVSGLVHRKLSELHLLGQDRKGLVVLVVLLLLLLQLLLPWPA